MRLPSAAGSSLGLAAVLVVGAASSQLLQSTTSTTGSWAGDAPRGFEVVYYDGPDANGELTGGRTLRETGDPAHVGVIPAQVETLFVGGAASPQRSAGGPIENRVHLVFVGDGYTASELGTFQGHVDNVVAGLFVTEPLGRYAEAFSVHRVDVISNESGVDNDPSNGINRDTALDMQYWCGGTERLLCVSVAKAASFALNAPAVDQIIALANSTKYGGAGYTSSNLATSSGGNGSALEIVKHELGHSFGGLADEYTYGGPTQWPGGEPSSKNLSTFDAASMASQAVKWDEWLGTSVPGFEGTTGTYEGGGYSVTGIYRPSPNSLMRSLGRPFNVVGAEEIIKEIYRKVSPIDGSSDPEADYSSSDTLTVTALTVGGAALPVEWRLDGAVIPGATGATLDLSTLGLPSCAATITATVVDDTPWVRDEAFRAAHMTDEVIFEINRVWQTEVCQTTPNSVGSGAVLGLDGINSVAAQDLTLTAFNGPPNSPILFFYGDTLVNVALGQGNICAAGNIQRVAVSFFDGLGIARRPIDWALDPVQLPGTALLPGSTWIFQGWFRDLDGAGMNSFDFTSAVQVTFCP